MASRTATFAVENDVATQGVTQLQARGRRGANLCEHAVAAAVERLSAGAAQAESLSGLSGSTHGRGLSRLCERAAFEAG